MENNEIIHKYELMVIVDAKLNDEDKDAIFKGVTDAVTKSGAKVINSNVWMEKHKLTFEINKVREGTYYLVNFEAESSANAKIDSVLKLNERILRFVITTAEQAAAEPASN